MPQMCRIALTHSVFGHEADVLFVVMRSWIPWQLICTQCCYFSNNESELALVPCAANHELLSFIPSHGQILNEGIVLLIKSVIFDLLLVYRLNIVPELPTVYECVLKSISSIFQTRHALSPSNRLHINLNL